MLVDYPIRQTHPQPFGDYPNRRTVPAPFERQPMGAYYEWHQNKAIGALGQMGAYYEWHENAPIDGLGATSTMVMQTTAAPVAMRTDPAKQQLTSMLVRTLKAKPAAVVTSWAVQKGDVQWAEHPRGAPAPTKALYTVNDAALEAARQSAQGARVVEIAVVTTKPVPPAVMKAAFAGSMYKPVAATAVYSQQDPRVVPQAIFVYTATLREPEDREGGRALASSVAQKVGGTLAIAEELPATGAERPKPEMPFQVALAAQQAKPEPTLPEQLHTPDARAQPGWIIFWALLGAAGGYALGGVAKPGGRAPFVGAIGGAVAAGLFARYGRHRTP